MHQVPLSHRRQNKHFDIPGHAHYLTFSCFGRRAFLSRERTCRWFIEAMSHARSKRPFDLWAWVIMPEHAHVLLLPHEGVQIGRILQAIKQPVSRKSVSWLRQNDPASLETMLDQQPSGKRSYRFWQRGGGYDRNLWSPEEIHEKIRYIHANPVRSGLVNRPSQWPWSSWRSWHEDDVDKIALDEESLPPLRR